MSEELKHRITELRKRADTLLREAEELERLAKNPPTIPEGYRLVEVVDCDGGNIELAGYCPELPAWTCLPDVPDGVEEIEIMIFSYSYSVWSHPDRAWMKEYDTVECFPTPEEAIANASENIH